MERENQYPLSTGIPFLLLSCVLQGTPIIHIGEHILAKMMTKKKSHPIFESILLQSDGGKKHYHIHYNFEK